MREKERVKRLEAIRSGKEARQNNSEYLVCAWPYHNSISQHPKNKVPSQLFLSDPGNTKSKLLTQCINCRNHVKMERAAKRREHNESEHIGMFCCSACRRTLDITYRAKTKNGSPSSQCVGCCDRHNKWYDINKGKGKESILRLKMEIILNNGYSCELCKCILLKGESSDGLPVKIIEPIFFDEDTSHIRDFVASNARSLELDALDFDHLTEDEQRQRGLLKETEPYFRKRQRVPYFKSDNNIRLEAAKCQLICKRCHTMETIRREGEVEQMIPSKARKTQFVNDLKLAGCSVCGYKNDKLLRFFEMDHIDPNTKIASISYMIRREYNIDDIIEECAKCRVLCGYCHRIHTRNQIRDGVLISGGKTLTPLLSSDRSNSVIDSIISDYNRDAGKSSD